MKFHSEISFGGEKILFWTTGLINSDIVINWTSYNLLADSSVPVAGMWK
jgi:hypothetical protein